MLLLCAVNSRNCNGGLPTSHGGATPEETHKPIPSYSSGGSAREGLLLEKPPPSHIPLQMALLPHVRGGSVSRRALAQLQRRPPHLASGAQLRRNAQAYSQLLFGREREGGASLREAASLAMPLQMVLLPDAPAALSAAVNSRNCNGGLPHLAWGRNSEGTHKPIPSYSSGQGARREGLL